MARQEHNHWRSVRSHPSPVSFQHQRRNVGLARLASLRLQPVVRSQAKRVLDGVVRSGARVVLLEQPLAELEELEADGVVTRGLPCLVLARANIQASLSGMCVCVKERGDGGVS